LALLLLLWMDWLMVKLCFDGKIISKVFFYMMINCWFCFKGEILKVINDQFVFWWQKNRTFARGLMVFLFWWWWWWYIRRLTINLCFRITFEILNSFYIIVDVKDGGIIMHQDPNCLLYYIKNRTCLWKHAWNKKKMGLRRNTQ
jgi:hypothetical protein